jgi:hypothetical protein
MLTRYFSESAAMPETRDLRELAREFRQHAGETQMPAYAQLMLQAALDLEALVAARGLGRFVSSEAVLMS